jgi:tRNA uridine 5-carbamoylmethylation protein Kti12
MKTLIVMSAFPGSGKSTWCKKYKEEHPNTYIISSDDIRFELTGEYQDFSKQKEVWETFERRIHEYADKGDDITVILDALTDLNTLRIKYADCSPEYDKHILVWIRKDFEEIKKYNKERSKELWVPDEVLEVLYNKFEEPSEEAKKYYDEVIEVKGFF